MKFDDLDCNYEDCSLIAPNECNLHSEIIKIPDQLNSIFKDQTPVCIKTIVIVIIPCELKI
jgi:hypothetical protein